MKNTLIKISTGIVLGVFLVLFFRCDPKCPEVSTKTATVVETDTVSTRDIQIQYVPGPERIVYITEPVYIEVTESGVYQEFKIDEEDLQATASMISVDTVSDFKLDYSVTAKETFITDTITINNTVTHTITNTIEAKRKMNLYLGTNVIFSPNSFNGVNFNVGLKTRKDFVFEVGYNASFTGGDSYEAGIKIPLFHKKK
jgi:hypothetical protein